MPPITKEGQAVKNRIAEFRQNVNNGATAAGARATVRALENPTTRNQNRANQLNQGSPNFVGFGTPNQSTGFKVNVPDTVPAESLNGNFNRNDIRGMRDNLEQSNLATEQLNTQFSDLNTSIGSNAPLSYSDPDTLINRLTLNRPISVAEQQREGAFNQQMSSATNYGAQISTARTEANKSLGLDTIIGKLAKTREDYALREQRLDQQLKDFETNAERRGVAREFVESEKNKLKSEALDDLANLAAIEKAQSGSLEEARGIVDDIMADKKTAFELQNQQLQNQINYYSTKVGEENKDRALQLQIALDDRKTKQDALIAKETAIKKLAVESAAENADQGTVNAILNAKTEEEAIRLASPFIGRLDRLQAQASIRASNASAANSSRRQTEIVDIDGVKTLIDSQTGEVISQIKGDGSTSDAFANALASNDIDNVSSILTNSAIGSAVGPSALARTEPGIWGATKRFFTGALAGGAAGAAAGAAFGGVGAIPGAIIGALGTGVVNASRGSMDQLTGDRQNFIGTVENMRAELTKDKLAQAKGEGVTFGALSDGERGLIANAATKIGNWAITEDGTINTKVTGYNIDEESFKREVDTINYFKKLDAVLQGTPPESIGVITQPDGTMWVANSDGTLSELKRQ
jgi:uncharacterized membrane protein